MSMLARYRKPGGIDQLVALLESCLGKKREALLATIANEDKGFAEMVKAKVLTMERIFKWGPLLICEATTRIGDKPLAVALKNCPPEWFKIATHTMKDLKRRDVQNFYEILNPSAVEIESAQIKLIEAVRSLIKDGTIKLDENENPVLMKAG